MFFGLLSKNIKEIETTLSPFFTGGRNQLTPKVIASIPDT
jgi:hypothetical protein